MGGSKKAQRCGRCCSTDCQRGRLRDQQSALPCVETSRLSMEAETPCKLDLFWHPACSILSALSLQGIL